MKTVEVNAPAMSTPTLGSETRPYEDTATDSSISLETKNILLDRPLSELTRGQCFAPMDDITKDFTSRFKLKLSQSNILPNQ